LRKHSEIKGKLTMGMKTLDVDVYTKPFWYGIRDVTAANRHDEMSPLNPLI